MKLVLKYYGGGAYGHHDSVIIPVEAESKEAAYGVFMAALTSAVEQGERFFDCWGRRHYAYNFMNETTQERVSYLAHQRARNPGLTLSLTVVEQQGRLYWLRLPKILTVDEWFDKARPTVEEEVPVCPS